MTEHYGPPGVEFHAPRKLFWEMPLGWFRGRNDFTPGSPLAIIKKRGTDQSPARETVPAQRTSTIRVMHGFSAAAIILLFLALHISNHLLGLIGAETHAAFMKMGAPSLPCKGD